MRRLLVTGLRRSPVAVWIAAVVFAIISGVTVSQVAWNTTLAKEPLYKKPHFVSGADETAKYEVTLDNYGVSVDCLLAGTKEALEGRNARNAKAIVARTQTLAVGVSCHNACFELVESQKFSLQINELLSRSEESRRRACVVEKIFNQNWSDLRPTLIKILDVIIPAWHAKSDRYDVRVFNEMRRDPEVRDKLIKLLTDTRELLGRENAPVECPKTCPCSG